MPRRNGTNLGLVLSLIATVSLAGCGAEEDAPGAAVTTSPSASSSASPSGAEDGTAVGELQGADGTQAGTVELQFGVGRTTLVVEASGLTPGPHGFHIHAIGACEADSPDPAAPTKTGDFLSAGGHLAKEGQVHGGHDGDLPSLMAGADGTARMTVTTDTLLKENVLDEDGSAAMIHATADNFRNVPERYAPDGPDETTSKTGDSGSRVACAVLTAE